MQSLALPAQSVDHPCAAPGSIVGDALLPNSIVGASPTAHACRGQPELVARCAAGFTVHPTQPHVLLMFGGFGYNPEALVRLRMLPEDAVGDVATIYEYFNDVVSINTRT